MLVKFAANVVVVTPLANVLDCECSRLNPVSLFELSTQVKLIDVELAAVPANVVGADGAVGIAGVVALAVDEYVESPAEFVADTLK